MKLIVVGLLAFLSLSQLCASLDDDYIEPAGDFGDGVPGGDAAGRVNDGNDGYPAHDPTLDQEALVGGQAARKRLTELPKEEADKEIRKLVERIDSDSDGQLDRKELFTWLSRVEDMAFVNEANSVFHKEDTDRDGYVTVEEYLANSGLPDDVPDESEEVKMMEKDIRKRFEIADSDKDGRLSESEFSVFVHPDRHEEMLEHLVNDQLSRFDKDSDGKVSFDEYMRHYNPSGKPQDELPDWMAGEQREFEQKLDVNKDGYLDDSEIRQWIAPNDDEFFNDEIDHLLNHIDENKDDKLSYDEVLAQFDVLVDSPLTDYGHAVHEEL